MTMTKCPYCYGDIPNNAKKCRHCGEWVNKESSGLDLAKTKLKEGLDFLNKKKKERAKKRWGHIYQPSDSKPLILRRYKFRSNTFSDGNKTMDYDNIRSLFFTQSTRSTNGMLSETETRLIVFLHPAGDISLDFDENSSNYCEIFISSGMIRSGNKYEREILEFIYRYLARRTFKKRLNIIAYSLKHRGYFSYPGGVKIYTDGTITMKEKKENIFIANDAGLLIYGNHKLSGRNSITDPFKFVIYKNSGPKIALAGIEFSSRLSFQVYFDKDVFDGIFNYAIENRTFEIS